MSERVVCSKLLALLLVVAGLAWAAPTPDQARHCSDLIEGRPKAEADKLFSRCIDEARTTEEGSADAAEAKASAEREAPKRGAAVRRSDLTVFGYELGTKPTVPECPYTRSNSFPGGKMYGGVPSQECWQDGEDFGDNFRKISVSLWGTGINGMVNYEDPATLLLRDGVLVAFQFYTNGIHYQERDLEVLKAKYGPPTSTRTRVAQNLAGASLQVIEADWRLSDLKVHLTGAAGRFDVGGVTVILLPAGDAAYDAYVRHLEAARNRRKL